MRQEGVTFPPYAYVPGQNTRHSEGAFDAIRETAQTGMSDDELAHADAFMHGLAYLEAGYYWEAHEVLEPVWMACPPNAASRLVTQGLIQFANAQLKAKMNRSKASVRLCDLARNHFRAVTETDVLGVDKGRMLAEIELFRQSQIMHNIAI